MLEEIVTTLHTVPTWAQVVSAVYTVYVFLTGNTSLVKRSAQLIGWLSDRVLTWYHRPSQTTLLKHEVAETNKRLDRLCGAWDVSQEPVK